MITHGFAFWVILLAFCRLLIFSKSTFSKNYFRNTIRVSIRLDPDHAQHFAGLDFGPTVSKGYEQTTLVGKAHQYQSH